MRERNIFKDQTLLESWEQTFGKNKCLWLLPIGGPHPEQGLDYQANIPVAGVLSEILGVDEPENTLLVSNVDN